jgi:chlorobactene glucosyltransferase
MTLIFYILISIAFIVFVLFSYRLQLSFRRFKIKKQYTAAISAPSVTVCIPARNEMHAMGQCLERVLESDYTKLEVIVYDDSSTDDTSFLIRSFAHDGVRFVPGGPLPAGWLGKNYALEILAREASGTFLVFMDVDTFIEPTTISQLVGYTLTEKTEMVSVIPGRNDTWRPSVLFGHLRYFWELVLWNNKHLPTSSSLWMIKRHILLDAYGGFDPIKTEVSPESALATHMGTQMYHCLINNKVMGVTYEKKWQSQAETSRRLLYPKAGGMLLNGLFYSVVLFIISSVPFLLITSLVVGSLVTTLLCTVILVCFMLLYGTYLRHMWKSGWWLGLLLWPVVCIQELVFLVMSITGYITHTITWKGRPVSKVQDTLAS